MTCWGFLTSHARVLPRIAHDTGARLRDLAASLGSTERSAHGIVTDLAEAGYVVKQKDGRRNRRQVQARLPLPEPATREPAIGEVPRPPRGRRRQAAADRDPTRLRPPQPSVHAGTPADGRALGSPDRLIWPQALDGLGHRRPSRPGPFLRQIAAPAPSPRPAANPAPHRSLPRGQLPEIAPLPPAGSSPAGPG